MEKRPSLQSFQQMTQLEKEKMLNEQHVKEKQEQERLRLLRQFEMQKQQLPA